MKAKDLVELRIRVANLDQTRIRLGDQLMAAEAALQKLERTLEHYRNDLAVMKRILCNEDA